VTAPGHPRRVQCQARASEEPGRDSGLRRCAQQERRALPPNLPSVIIGVPTETKDGEARVALTPAGAHVFAKHGHSVLLQAGAGALSGLSDDEYARQGAQIVPTAKAVFDGADLILKVKEPLPPEYPLLRRGQVLFTYLHLASSEELTRALLDSGVIALAYETVQVNGGLPLLLPMSEIAGKLSVQVGAHYLEAQNGGRGVLLGGIPGVPPAEVVVVGGGIVGAHAAGIAAGMGATVTIIDINNQRLRELDALFGGRVVLVYSTPFALERACRFADVLVGAVLVPGARAPRVITEAMVKKMKRGSVIVDVAVDQGGCIETIRPTSHSEPTYELHGVVHYAVPNIPALTPRTATHGLTNATLSYALKIANQGVVDAIRSDPALAKGVNLWEGRIVHPAVAAAFGREAAAIPA